MKNGCTHAWSYFNLNEHQESSFYGWEHDTDLEISTKERKKCWDAYHISASAAIFLPTCSDSPTVGNCVGAANIYIKKTQTPQEFWLS